MIIDWLDLETDTPRALQVPQDRIETVARAGEWIYDPDRAIADHWQHDLGNVLSNLVSQWVFDRLQTGARQDADTALVPRPWRQPVQMDVVWVVEAIASVFLNFPQLDKLIPLLRAE